MTKNCNHTLVEIEEKEFVNQQYQNRINLIGEFLHTCHLTIEDLCVHLNIDTSTYYRYKNGTSHIGIDSYIYACTFFQQYMKEHKIAYTSKLINMIEETNIFAVGRMTKV